MREVSLSDNLTIKPCDENDLTFYHKLRNDEGNAWSLNWYSFTPESENETLDFILRKRGELYTVWFEDRVQVGYVQTSPMETVGPNYIEFRHVGIYIDASYRGKGYGKLALKLLEQERTSQYGLIAKVDSRNHPSLNLFKSAGYVEAGSIPVIDSAEMLECAIVYLVRKF